MTTNRKRSFPWVTAVALLLAMYVGSYFVASDYDREKAPIMWAPPPGLTLGQVDQPPPGLPPGQSDQPGMPESTYSARHFRRDWMVSFYIPLIYIETKVRGERIVVQDWFYGRPDEP